MRLVSNNYHHPCAGWVTYHIIVYIYSVQWLNIFLFKICTRFCTKPFYVPAESYKSNGSCNNKSLNQAMFQRSCNFSQHPCVVWVLFGSYPHSWFTIISPTISHDIPMTQTGPHCARLKKFSAVHWLICQRISQGSAPKPRSGRHALLGR